MSHSFIAYIDEAGDEGLSGRWREPGKGGGSSHWLSIGATVWRMSRDLDAVRWGRTISSKLPQQKRHKPLHFMEMDHPQRIMAIGELEGKPFRIVSVIVNKTGINPENYLGRNQLYHYICRYLIERISWLCRDLRPHVPEGDGRVKLVFSRKRTMNYQHFRDYVQRLRNMNDPEIRIHWPVVDIFGIEAHDHGARIGLQIADLAVSGLAAALEPDFYGNVEPRFARSLKPHVYARNGNYMSYGTKMFPPAEQLELSDQQREFLTLFS
jgi:hypothetical protein